MQGARLLEPIPTPHRPDVAEVRAAFDGGQGFSAYQLALRVGFLRVDRHTAPAHAVLAARLLRHAGAPRRARKIVLDSWRRHRTDPAAAQACAAELGDAGPLATLEFMDRIDPATWRRWSGEDQASWLGERARALAVLRDFVGAERAWAEARDHHLGPRGWTIRALIDDALDRLAAALEAIAEARARSRWDRLAIAVEAHLLCRSRRFGDARALLAEATRRIEAPSLLYELHTREREDRDYDAALATLERAVRMSPELEREVHDRYVAAFVNLHYLRGDVARSVAISRLSQDEALHQLADRGAGAGGPRRELGVAQVPQHAATCAPATLTSLAEYWGEPVDHLEVAEAICHDGTPAASERRWCAERGFAVREFTVTWDTAVQLIDRGLPFHLSTTFTTSAHAQAVAGYDPRRRTLLVRNPSALSLVEYDWDQLAATQAPFGPRGLVPVPVDRAGALDAVTLPDAALYDLVFAVDEALDRHDRAAADAAYQELVRVAPDHRLRHQARRALASYDGDLRGVIAWADALLAVHPGDARLLVVMLSASRDVATRAARLAAADELMRHDHDDPAVLAACAQFLAEDGEAGARAAALAQRAVRHSGRFAPAYHVLADRRWAEADRRGATRLYRIASCLAEGDEGAAWTYFVAAQIVGDVDAALDHLRDRVDRMIGRSAGPARTLCDAYAAIGRGADGLDVLVRAQDAHPEDGELLLAIAEERRVRGDLDAAERDLAVARDRCHDARWRRCAAALAVQRGRRDEALALWRQIAEDHPLDVAAQHEYVTHLASAGRGDDAGAHLRQLVDRFPHHLQLARMLHDHLAARDDDAARRFLELVVHRHPTDGWALTCLAGACIIAGDLDRARRLLDQARATSHEPAELAHVEALLAKQRGRRDDARARYRAAIAADADSAGSIAALLALARDAGEAAADLDHVAAELDRQGSSGPGLEAYAAAVRRWCTPQRAIALLTAQRHRRGHLVAAWIAELGALVELGHLDGAAAVAASATARFDRSWQLWREVAAIHERRGDRAAQIAALERAAVLAPHWREVTRLLAEALAGAGDLDRARALLDQATAAEPFDATNHGFRAALEHGAGQVAAAIEHLHRAVALDPEYAWAWDRLLAWSRDVADVIAAAREVVRTDPRAVWPRMVIAEHARDLTIDQRVAALGEVADRFPDRVGPADLAARLLAGADRWDEALAACRPPFWGDAPPVSLRGRAAWVLERRGELDRAVDEMLAAIAAAPSLPSGIDTLMAWAQAADRYAELAERAVAAAPGAALAHAHLGEAYRLAGRAGSAEVAFRCALDLDVGCHLARLGMFDVCYARGDLAAAVPYLDGMSDASPWVLARRAQAAAAAGRVDDADAALLRLLLDHAAESIPIDEAVDGYRRAGLVAPVERLLDRAAAAPDASDAIGRAWWRHVVAGRAPANAWRRIQALPAESPAAARCVALHLEALARRPDAVPSILWLAFRHRRRLRAVAVTWASVGWALLHLGWARVSRRWLSDHARRRDVEPWMLLNLARARLWTGAVRDGWAVCRAAMTLPRDGTSSAHRLLLAPADALEDPSVAAATLAAATVDPDDVEDRFLVRLTEIVIAYRRRPSGAALDAAIRELLRELPGALSNPLCRHVYRRVIRELAREDGGDVGWLRWLLLESRALGWV
jgi:cellulose synthase operon protein C